MFYNINTQKFKIFKLFTIYINTTACEKRNLIMTFIQNGIHNRDDDRHVLKRESGEGKKNQDPFFYVRSKANVTCTFAY